MTARVRLALALALASTIPVLVFFLFVRVTALGIWLLVLAAPVSWFVAGWLVQPLAELETAARRLRAGDLQARAVVAAGSEWAEVAAAMASLAGELDEVTRTFEEQVQQRTEALERLADQLRAVGQVGQQVAAVLEPQRLLHFVVRVLRGTFTYDVAAVLQREGNHLVLAAAAARDRDDVPLGRVFPASGPDAPPLAAARGLAGAADVSPLVAGLNVQAELAVPVRVGSRTLGILVVQSTEAAAFDADDEFTVSTIAGQVAVALENARLLAAERQLRDLAIVEERNRMAMEIHDTLAQGFMGVIMQLQAAKAARETARAASEEAARSASGVAPDAAKAAPDAAGSLAVVTAGEEHLAEAEALARESLQEARRSVWNLRPLALESGDLGEALTAAAARFEQHSGVTATVAVTGNPARLDGRQEAGLLRIAQEALHNVAKHAQANTVNVALTIGADTATLVIADDGIGFDSSGGGAAAAAAGGFGLASMAERARGLGGQVTVTSRPRAGCRVEVIVPLGGEAVGESARRR